MNIIRKIIKWALMLIFALVLFACLSYTHSIGPHYYSFRSALLIITGVIFLVLAYHIIKTRQKYKIRTFSEIIDSVLSSGWRSQLFALLVLSIIAFLFSWALIDSINELQWNGTDSPIDNHQSFWLTICYFFDPGNLNITNHLNPGIQGFVSLIVAILGMTLLTGLFVSTFTNIIEQRVESVKSGTITYKGISSHYVIIGFCDLTEAIIRGIFEKQGKDSKIILLTKEHIDSVRESLYDILNSNQFDGQLVIYSGDYHLSENLNRLNLPASKEIYLLGEVSTIDYYFDVITCYEKIEEKISKHSSIKKNHPIPVYARLDSVMAFSAFQRIDIRTNFDNTYFRPFNSYDLWSRVVWNGGEIEVCDSFYQKKMINYPFINFNNDSKFVHLVVSGFNQMAQALLLQTIRSAHFSNYTEENDCKTEITIVDEQIKESWLGFSAHFRHLEQVYDIKINLQDCLIEEIEKEITIWSCDGNQKLIIAICSDNQNEALSKGLNLPAEVYYQHGKKSTELPIVLVEQKTFSSIWELAKKKEQTELDDKVNNPKEFRKAQYDKYHNVYPFGMKIRRIYPNEIEDLKACIIHADYEDQWCNTDKTPEEIISIHHLFELVENKDDENLKSLLEKAFLKWYTLPENVRAANRYQTDNHKQIKMILDKNGVSSMEQLSKLDEDLLYLCSDIEHRRWIGERIVAGWQQSPYKYDGDILRQDSLRMHYDIRKTSEIKEEISKDDNVIINVLMLDQICEYIKNHQIL